MFVQLVSQVTKYTSHGKAITLATQIFGMCVCVCVRTDIFQMNESWEQCDKHFVSTLQNALLLTL